MMLQGFDRLPELLLPWYQAHKRTLPWREIPAVPYHVWLSEIMLQQTRVEAVIPYYHRFLEKLPDISSLAAADDETILKLWEGLGYYTRVRNLRNAAQKIMTDHNGIFPSDVKEIRALPGIGDYTAGAIASIVYGQCEPAVDGNVLRVTARFAGITDDITKTQIKQQITDALRQIYPAGKTPEFTQSLMELGALVCLPNGTPKCNECPLRELCVARLDHITDLLPIKKPKKPRKEEQRTILILHSKGKIALRKRPAKGLLASLWEFPSLPGYLTADEVAEHYPECRYWQRGPEAVHIFSHIEWHMRSFTAESPEELEGFQYFTPDQFPAVPSAFKAFLPVRT